MKNPVFTHLLKWGQKSPNPAYLASYGEEKNDYGEYLISG